MWMCQVNPSTARMLPPRLRRCPGPGSQYICHQNRQSHGRLAEHRRHLHNARREYGQRRFAARLCQRPSAGWHELCLFFSRGHERWPRCLLVGYRSHIVRRKKSLQIVAHVNDSLTGTQNLTNTVDVSGKHENDKNVSDNDTADFLVQEASVSVTKTADPTVGSPGMAVTFSLIIKNTGKSALTHSFVSDLLPDGLSYVSSTNGGRNSGHYINWSDLGPLAINDTKTLSIEAKIDDSVSGTLTNTVGVESKPEHGENVTSSSTADVVSEFSGMTVEKTAIPDDGYRGTVVTFPINITNNETVKLAHVKAVDVLPLGMDYEPDGSIPSPTSAVQTGGRWVVTWNDLGPLNSSESHNLILKSRITGTVLGTLTNEVNTTGIPEFGNNVIAGDTADVVVSNAGLNITKEASQTDGVPGTTINYTITINNTGPVEFCQVSSQDILPEGLSYIGDDHGGVLAGPNLVTWDNLGCLLPGEKIVIRIGGINYWNGPGEIEQPGECSGQTAKRWCYHGG